MMQKICIVSELIRSEQLVSEMRKHIYRSVKFPYFLSVVATGNNYQTPKIIFIIEVLTYFRISIIWFKLWNKLVQILTTYCKFYDIISHQFVWKKYRKLPFQLFLNYSSEQTSSDAKKGNITPTTESI